MRYGGTTSNPLFGVAVSVCRPIEGDMVSEAIQHLNGDKVKLVGSVQMYEQ